jgi:putative transposase
MEVPDPVSPPRSGTIGIDLGVHALAVTSDGSSFDNPRTLQRHAKRLAKLQRELFRRKKGSNNRAKTRAKLAKLHRRIRNIRNHTLHNISAHVVYNKRPARLVVENLAVSNLLKNHHAAQAIQDASMSKLRRQLEYKGAWAGAKIVVASRVYPSSKRCSRCGHLKKRLAVGERTYRCDNCGLIMDRDLNAARNLAQYPDDCAK